MLFNYTRNLSFALFIILNFSSSAQKVKFKYGKVDKSEFEIVSYEGDSTYEAINLFDVGKSEIVYDINTGWVLVFTRHKRIKILNSKAFHYADIEIGLQNDGSYSEELSEFKAEVYNLDGKQISSSKLKKNDGFKEVVDQNFERMKFTLPEVRVGSILEYQYTIRSNYFSNLRDWTFQGLIPTFYSEYQVKIPEYFKYERKFRGTVPMEVNSQLTTSETINFTSTSRGVSSTGANSTGTFSSSQLTYQKQGFKWVAKNIPAIELEPFMASPLNYISRVIFQLGSIRSPNTNRLTNFTSSWDEVGKTVAKDINLDYRLKNPVSLFAELKPILDLTQSETEKISIIYEFVLSKIDWDGKYGFRSGQSFKELIVSRSGNSSDVNLFLINLLNAAGFKANAVLIRTRDYGFIDRLIPLSRQFNHLIAKVDYGDGYMLLDATQKDKPFTLLPKKDLNQNGLQISPQGGQWIPLIENGLDYTIYETELTLNESGELTGNLKTTFKDYAAITERRRIDNMDSINFQSLEGDRLDLGIISAEVKGELEKYEPLLINYALNASEKVDQLDDLMFVNPFIIPHQTENPFKRDSREYPIDFTVGKRFTYLMNLTIPKGYIIDELPESKSMVLPEGAGSFRYIIRAQGNKISLMCQFNILKPLFTNLEYRGLREFYDKAIDLEGQLIVLKKTGTD